MGQWKVSLRVVSSVALFWGHSLGSASLWHSGTPRKTTAASVRCVVAVHARGPLLLTESEEQGGDGSLEETHLCSIFPFSEFLPWVEGSRMNQRNAVMGVPATLSLP